MIFTVEDIGEILGCGRDKVIKLKKELKKYDLLEEVRQGLNKPNLIYSGALSSEHLSKPLLSTEVGNSDSNDTDNYSFEEEFNTTTTQKQKNISRKVDRFTKYNKDYIWQPVDDQLLKEKFSNTTAEFVMSRLEERYLYALENMRFARSAEAVAENVFNGIFSDFNQDMRKQHSM